MTLKHVVLPAPFGPISPRISPGLMSKETSLSAARPPKRMVTVASSSKGAMGASFQVGIAFAGVVEGHQLLVGLPSSAVHPPRQQALRTEDHHHHEHDPEPHVPAGVEE